MDLHYCRLPLVSKHKWQSQGERTLLNLEPRYPSKSSVVTGKASGDASSPSLPRAQKRSRTIFGTGPLHVTSIFYLKPSSTSGKLVASWLRATKWETRQQRSVRLPCTCVSKETTHVAWCACILCDRELREGEKSEGHPAVLNSFLLLPKASSFSCKLQYVTGSLSS